MIKFFEKGIYVVMLIALVLPMIGAIQGGNLSNWGEITKGIAQLKVTVSLGYAALLAAIATTFKHAGQFAKHKKDLYHMILAFVLMIFLDITLYAWSFTEYSRYGNIPVYIIGCWAFLYVTANFLKVIRNMMNIEEK
ncbi:DUF2878 family protein [Brevibacillus brevis]|nr:DUF2878 family protein [Brevibacillus brevis]